MVMLRNPPSAHPAAPEDSRSHAGVLGQTIERNIIPRLVEAHRVAPAPAAPELQEPAGSLPTGTDPTPFAHMLLAPDPALAFEYVAALRRRGVSIESVYLDVITPAARLLGEWWESDECSFTDVTLGAGRLQQILREHSLSRDLNTQPVSDGRRVLLAPAPGEQHSLGLLMTAEFFRRAGWEVHGGPTDAGTDPVHAVSRSWYDVVGFSLAAEVHLEALQRTIARLRVASRNPQVVVMAGGAALNARPALHAVLLLDIELADAETAPALAERCLQDRPR